jgi:uncharacterized protein
VAGRSLSLLFPLILTACGSQAAVPAASGGPAPVAATSIAPAVPTGAAPAGSTGPAAANPPATTARPSAPALTAVASAQPTPVFARGSLTIQTTTVPVNMSVEIADDEVKREYGLMNRTSLAPDSGMLFVFQPPAVAQQLGFWMKDTLIPLSIAFVEPNLSIESLQDMQALDETIHYAPRDYGYAIEASLGYFTSHAVQVGDTVKIQR